MKSIIVLIFLIFIGIILLLSIGVLIGQNSTILGIPSLIVNSTSKPIEKISPTPHLDPYKIYNLINDYRASNDINKLVWDPSMCDFVQKRLIQIHTDYSHSDFLANAKKVFGYNLYLGENISQGETSEQELVSDWINSQEHRENILNIHFDRTCISSDVFYGNTYSIQEFASYERD